MNLVSETVNRSTQRNRFIGLALATATISMLLLSGCTSYGSSTAKKEMASPNMDIVDTAIAAGSFSTLVTALQEAELVDTLRSDGPFTVFAPTDEAFDKIPPDQLQALLADKETLTAVLTYHVVPGKVMAEDVVKISSAATVQGNRIQIDTSNGVMVDEAKVIQTDILTSNGVIHVIDTVITP